MQAGIYRHYKGGYYQVLGVADDSNTGVPWVVYVSLTGAHLPGRRMRIRPLVEFTGYVQTGNPTDPNQSRHEGRYVYIGDEIPADAGIPLSGRIES